MRDENLRPERNNWLKKLDQLVANLQRKGYEDHNTFCKSIKLQGSLAVILPKMIQQSTPARLLPKRKKRADTERERESTWKIVVKP